MLVETRFEHDEAPPPGARRADAPPLRADAPGAAAPALRDLIAAGLVSLEAIGDPDRLPGGETAALAAICRQVAGPVYRLAPFHYAFAAGAAPAEAVAAALAAELGPEALWLGPTALLDGADAAPPDPAPEAALILLRAREGAVAAGLAAAGPGVQAVVDAAWAADCARLAASAAPGAPLERRLAALETRIETALETTLDTALEAFAAAEARAAAAPAVLAAVETRLATLAAAAEARAEARAEAFAAAEARAEAFAAAAPAAAVAAVETALGPALDAALGPGLARLAAATARAEAEAARLEALRDTIAVTLAEFLARIERRAAADAP